VYDRGSGDAERSVGPLSGLPQPLQNFCVAGFAFPQEAQLRVLAKGAAHSPQKLASAVFSNPQLAHRIDGHSGRQSEGTVDPRASYAQGTATGTATAREGRLPRRIRRTVASDTPTVFAIARPERPPEAISSTAWMLTITLRLPSLLPRLRAFWSPALTRSRMISRSSSYSPYLLAGLLRFGICGFRMVAETTSRKKRTQTYRYGWYYCPAAVRKGPAVCRHRVRYPRTWFEEAIVERFREATEAQAEAVADALNRRLAASIAVAGTRTPEIRAQLAKCHGEAEKLAAFIATGGDSQTVRQKLGATELRILRLEEELRAISQDVGGPPIVVHPTWIRERLRSLFERLRTDPLRAKVELGKHLEGDLLVEPKAGPAEEKRAVITGALKHDGLLASEAGGRSRLAIVAGA
jgi:Recombinase zinc beta ribbon domain